MSDSKQHSVSDSEANFALVRQFIDGSEMVRDYGEAQRALDSIEEQLQAYEHRQSVYAETILRLERDLARVTAAFDLLGQSAVTVEEHARLKEQLESAQATIREIGGTYDGVTPIFRKTGTKLLGADAFTYAPDICDALNSARRWPISYPAKEPETVNERIRRVEQEWREAQSPASVQDNA